MLAREPRLTYASCTYAYFLKVVAETFPRGEGIRYGQHYFNVLNEVRPKVANALRGSMLDPFYKEEVSPDVEKFVIVEWDN